MEKVASLTRSVAAGEGLRGHVLGQPTVFHIHAVDEDGRACCSGGDAFTVSIRGPSRVSPSLVDHGDGTYVCEWEGSVTGTYLVSVLLGGEHIGGSPTMASVVTPGHDPSQCRMMAPAGAIGGRVSPPTMHASARGVSALTSEVMHTIAGHSACFDIAFFDALARPVAMEPSTLKLSVTPWRSLYGALAASEVYAVRVPTTARSATDPAARAMGEVPTTARSGTDPAAREMGEVYAALDEGLVPPRRSARSSANHPMASPLAEPLQQLSLRAMPTPASYAANRRLVGVMLEQAGTYDLHVLLHSKVGSHPSPAQLTRAAGSLGREGVGQPSGSPLRVCVHPAAASATTSRCEAKPSDLCMRAGEARTFLIRTSDVFGNACDRGGAALGFGGEAWVHGEVRALVRDLDDGTYSVEWTSRVAGTHELRVLLDGTLLALELDETSNQTSALPPRWALPPAAARGADGDAADGYDAGAVIIGGEVIIGDGRGGVPPAPLRLVVEPNVLWAKTSSVSGEALHHATAGERAVILVHARDACGNSVRPSAQMRFGISLWDRQAKQPVMCGESGVGVMLVGAEVGGEGGGEGERGGKASGDEGEAGGVDEVGGGRHEGGEGGDDAPLTLAGRWLSESAAVFELSYTCQRSSTFDLHLWHSDPSGELHELAGSPQTLTIAPNVADCRGTRLELNGRLHDFSASHEELQAGDQLTAIVQIADRLGNPTISKPDELRLVLEGPSGCTNLDLFNAGSPIEGVHTIEGVHIINEELRLSGSYTLTATIRGSPVLGAPIGPIYVMTSDDL